MRHKCKVYMIHKQGILQQQHLHTRRKIFKMSKGFHSPQLSAWQESQRCDVVLARLAETLKVIKLQSV